MPDPVSRSARISPNVAVFRRIWAFVLTVVAMLAAPAMAASSHCAQLPETTSAIVAGADEFAPATFTPQGVQCPTGFAHERVASTDRCRRPGAISVKQRTPRRDCYAALDLGPVRAIPAQQRPSMQCASVARIDNVIAIRGRNAGWSDIRLSADKPRKVQITTLSRSAMDKKAGQQPPEAEDPYRQDCSPHDCRLIRLTTRSGTPSVIGLTLATPEDAGQTSFQIETEAVCPGR